jgi:hypothetical protein
MIRVKWSLKLSLYVPNLSGPILKHDGVDFIGFLTGLQIREDRFDSGTRLQIFSNT